MKSSPPGPAVAPVPGALSLDGLIARFWSFLDSVATTIVMLAAQAQRARPQDLVERDDRSFALADGPRFPLFRLDGDATPAAPPLPPAATAALSGHDVTVHLAPSHVLFRPLDLPEQAGDFLDGIVRAQIDRLTPWTAEDAAFGCSAPAPAGEGRISLTIAATARARLAPLLAALTTAGARSITLTAQPADGAAPILILQHKGSGALDAGRLRRGVAGVLAASTILAFGALLAAEFVGADLDARGADIGRQIAAQRRTLALARSESGEGAVLQALERRKHDTPATVLVLDWLSQALPDDTHLTELHVDGERVQLIGVSRDAPALIGRLEQSRHFTEATFVAPTTRAGETAGERFSIEARIRPASEVPQ